MISKTENSKIGSELGSFFFLSAAAAAAAAAYVTYLTCFLSGITHTGWLVECCCIVSKASQDAAAAAFQ